MTALDRFVDALNAHNCKPNRSKTAARCPAHEDAHASLSFGSAKEFAGVVVKCHAGCTVDDILTKLGLTISDLFDEPRDAKRGYTVVAEYPYLDEAGQALYVKVRYWPKDFRQYVPLPDGSKQWNLNGVRRVLYRLPEVKAAIAESRSVFVAEGEKDADALVAAGVVATCNTEGAAKPGQTPKWRKDYTEQLRGAMVTVVTDKDDTGMAHAKHIVKELTGVAAHVRLVEPLSGKDAYDHLEAGWPVDEFVEVFDQLQADAPPFPPNIIAAIGQIYAGVTVESAAQANHCSVDEIAQALTTPEARLIEPTSEWDAVDLLNAEFRDTPDILAGAIPVGVTLISAMPKVGKTRFLAQTSVAAVRGEIFLNRVVTRTKVLTLALEDGARRYRKSLHYLVGTNWPGRSELTVRTTSARLDEGGLTKIEQHLDQHPDCRLVIIDVLARVRPQGRGTNAYQLDYDALAPLQRMANIRQIAIVVVHHANQRAEVSDIFERISGTSGLIGVVDSLLLLQRRRSDDIGTLSISGREVEDQTIALGFTNGWWGPAPEGMPAELLSESKEVRALWLWLAEHDGASTDDLAKQYGQDREHHAEAAAPARGTGASRLAWQSDQRSTTALAGGPPRILVDPVPAIPAMHSVLMSHSLPPRTEETRET